MSQSEPYNKLVRCSIEGTASGISLTQSSEIGSYVRMGARIREEGLQTVGGKREDLELGL